jgi:hypothetical protein
MSREVTKQVVKDIFFKDELGRRRAVRGRTAPVAAIEMKRLR